MDKVRQQIRAESRIGEEIEENSAFEQAEEKLDKEA